jgi:hypothetical protein
MTTSCLIATSSWSLVYGLAFQITSSGMASWGFNPVVPLMPVLHLKGAETNYRSLKMFFLIHIEKIQDS